jgi:excinuclease ABC subunit C
LRDRAAQKLAYELAARIQDEIGALSWVACSQQATTMDAANLATAGWSRGMLVQFQIHGGRLRGWYSDQVATTPPPMRWPPPRLPGPASPSATPNLPPA